ncbi:asparagine synthase (glutamine-hydrolyzing) [Zooshikella ganghwensis]|uniref:asparagine synthase (glutamine-hydrolyzing) n=1 Tax=Zooshikella ganghwensis TaxID=202772 RepID=UPI0004064CD3|nr:asparagine synthase (glutamine-hydrolyzing) [Zooshikella ganghwensis]
MCGIAGWFSKMTYSPISGEERLKRMAKAISHRGPDGEGFYILDCAYFTHRRLSIIDIDGGNQPMLSFNKEYLITYNGEIYNYKDLRSMLINKGKHFKTESDTEVILNLYDLEGLEGFNRLRGMFAFALWDIKQKLGMLVRDPFGIKPLFIKIESDNTVVFASEAKAIIAKENSRGILSESVLHMIMNFRYIPSNQTLFKNIYQLKPGLILIWKNNKINIVKLSLDEEGKDESFNSIFRKTVIQHAVSDVEVGCYLSGGIDSALITSVVKEVKPYKIKTFTLGVGDDPKESENAKETAKILKVDNFCEEINECSPEDFKKLIWHLECPKVNSLQCYELARHASKYVKVTLSGLGADEIFLGYNAFKWLLYIDKSRELGGWFLRHAGKVINRIFYNPAKLYWSNSHRIVNIFKNINDNAFVYGVLRNIWDSEVGRKTIYGERMLDSKLDNAFIWLKENWSCKSDIIFEMKEFEWKTKLVNDLLWQEDRCSMAFGLEVRVPFLDQTLKNNFWWMSNNILLPNNQLKGFLKNTIYSYELQKIINRKKSGFQLDPTSLLKGQLSELTKYYLSKSTVNKYKLFNYEFIEMVLKSNNAKCYRWHYFILYMIIGTHIWLELFEEG